MNSPVDGKTPYLKVKAAVAKLPGQPHDERAFWRDAQGNVRVQLLDRELTSTFLPVLEGASGQVAGHVASLVDSTGQAARLDLDRLDEDAFIATDRLLRALHTLNYFSHFPDPGKLFLDVNQRFFSSISGNHGHAFRLLLDSLELPAEQVVIQVVGSGTSDLHTLAFAADNYRRNGFLTGLYGRDAYETHSLIGQIRPDFLSLWMKGEWSLEGLPQIVEAARTYRVRLIARNISNQSRLAELQKAGIEFFQMES